VSEYAGYLVPDLATAPHVFVLDESEGTVRAACSCRWFDERDLLDENSARALHQAHQASFLR
jgi:hypothetical protein